MKLRNGFVSNSSSSSFCIIGVHTDEDTYYNLQEKYSDLEFFNGDEEGYCVGLWATRYLEKEKLGDACVTVFKELSSILSSDDMAKLMGGRKIELIYDGYYS